MGWAEKNPVWDDDGYLITEAEIEANMGSGYRIGCVIGGAGLSVVPAFYGGYGFAPFLICGFLLDDDSYSCGDWAFAVGLIAIEMAGIIASYHLGKYYDRQRTIYRIKAQRRKQKEHAFGEQDITDGFYFRLLKGTF